LLRPSATLFYKEGWLMMENKLYPNITSFMIRFVEEGSTNSAGEPILRGSIRHIQTDKEIVFTSWQDALSFIKSYVSIEALPGNAKSDHSLDRAD
jgi:hypothetical protein